MVSKGDLLRSIKLYKLNKTQSFELIFEAMINNALLFDINNVKYDPLEVINDLINDIWVEPFNPKKDFKYGIYHDDLQICDEKFRESVECLSDPKYTLIVFFRSDNPKFHS